MATQAEVVKGPVVAVGIRAGKDAQFLQPFTRGFKTKAVFESWERRKGTDVPVKEVRYGTKRAYLEGERGPLMRPPVEVRIGP